MERHITGFDYLRVVAMFSVVWIHGCDTSATLSWLNTVNVYAVPCFIMMSVFLGFRSLDHSCVDRVVYIKRRAARLLIPLFVWSIAYYGMRYGKSILLGGGGPPVDWSWMEMLKGRASYQLWFLPALFLYQVIILYCLGLVRLRFWLSTTISILCVWITVLVANSHWLGELRGGFDFLFLHYLPFVFLVFIIFRLIEHYGSMDQLKKLPYVCVFVLSLAVLMGGNEYFNLIIYSVAVFLVALTVRFKERSIVMTLSTNSMGIYLLHGFFLEGGQAFASILKVDLTNTLFALGLIVLAYLMSVTASVLMRRFRFVRKYWILG